MTKERPLTLVDSSGWIELASDGPQADRYSHYLEQADHVITPSIVVYEVYKRLKKDASESVADAVLAHMGNTRLIPLDDHLAIQAAETSLTFGLAMADAIVYTTAQAHRATLVTGDADFKDLPNVIYFKKD
jgi:predicted nucleic acid-binding protein